MKKVLVISLLSFAIFISAFKASAFLQRPFGGVVSTLTTGGVVCAGYGPIIIKPVGIAPTGPYSVLIPNPFMATFPVTPGVWILGMYTTSTSPGCLTTSVPPVTFPTIPVTIYGTSRLP